MSTRTTYRQPVPLLWWTRRRSYTLFMLRELSCVFVAWTVVYLLLLINALGDGSDAYQRFLDWSARPWVLVVNIAALAFLLLHTVTWFGLAPKAMAVRMRGRPVSSSAVVAGHFALWAILSAVIAWLVLR